MIDRKTFFNRVRAEPFGGFLSASQVAGITTILDLWDRLGETDPRHLAYALATTFHETARTMQPIEEYGHGKGRTYGVPTGPWHLVYDGRGDVQLTWIGNYTKATARLRALGFDVDLVQHPEQAMRPDVAAMVLLVGMKEGWFSSAKLSDYFNAARNDAVGARRIINGTDKAEEIAGYYRAFVQAIRPDYPSVTSSPAVARIDPPPPVPASPFRVDAGKPELAAIEGALNTAAGEQAGASVHAVAPPAKVPEPYLPPTQPRRGAKQLQPETWLRKAGEWLGWGKAST